MAEKKNIVIKLKYPVGTIDKGHLDSAIVPQKTVTVWHYKRIAVAVLALLALLGLLIYALWPSDHLKQAKSVQIPVIQQVQSEKITENTVQPATGVVASSDNKNIVRAVLTNKISNNEPVGKGTLPIVAGEKKPVTLYYFVQLSDMKGKTVYHEWLLDNKLVSKKKVNISDASWRTTSKQAVAYTTNSNWLVRLVDEKNNVLTQQAFTVVPKK